MASVGLDETEHLVDLDDLPFPPPEGRDSVLANSIRRVIEASQQPPQDSIAAFQNYI